MMRGCVLMAVIVAVACKRARALSGPISCSGVGNDAPCNTGETCQLYTGGSRRRTSVFHREEGRRLFGAPSATFLCLVGQCTSAQNTVATSSMPSGHTVDGSSYDCPTYVMAGLDGTNASPAMAVICSCVQSASVALPACRPTNGDLSWGGLTTQCTSG